MAYRQYEDPYDLTILLEDAEKRLRKAEEEASDDVDRLADLHNEVEELKERISFAWQDQEYDEIGA